MQKHFSKQDKNYDWLFHPQNQTGSKKAYQKKWTIIIALTLEMSLEMTLETFQIGAIRNIPDWYR